MQILFGKKKMRINTIIGEKLANYCPCSPVLVFCAYMTKVKERVIISNKKKKADALSNGQTIMKNYHNST